MRNIPALISLGVSSLLAAVTGLLILETYLLFSHQPSITQITECLVASFPLWTLFVVAVVAAGLGSLFAHFFWPAFQPRRKP